MAAARRAFSRLVGPRFLKRWAPRSLWGRSLLIIVLPVALMQVAVTAFFFNAHWERVSGRLSDGLAGDIAWVVEDFEHDPAGFATLRRRAERSMELSVVYWPRRALPRFEAASFFAPVDRSLRRALEDHLKQPFWFDTTRYDTQVDIRVQVRGGVLRIIADQDRAFVTQGHIFLIWMIGATLILTGVAVLFIRNQVRAIERLAEAAEAFGRGQDSANFKPHGAREVRQAARAFIDMKARIQRHIEQRTALLASVSHDLRTPLTRLNLELALAEASPRTEAMKRDLSEMGHMIDEYLAFAKGEGGEAMVTVDLCALAQGVAGDARRAGATVEVRYEDELSTVGRPAALRRALANLVGNAAAYGTQVVVEVRRSNDGFVELSVEDDGPGIAPERYEEAMKPFNRLDKARSQNEKGGGVGLGLAIARDAARAHGGEVVLGKSPLGGLRAVIRLPAGD